MGSTEVKTVADFLVTDFEREMQTTLRVLEAVPHGRLDYRPLQHLVEEPGLAKTGLGLLRHIALEDRWLLNGIADGTFPPPPDDSDACGIMNPADAAARYRSSVPLALDRVRAMSGDQLAGSLNLFDMITASGLSFLAVALKHSGGS